MPSVRLGRLEEVMKRRYIDSGYLPGMLTYGWRKGHLVHTGICGQMDIERGKPMREDAIFRIYSMSKPITAARVSRLVEDGGICRHDTAPNHILGVECLRGATPRLPAITGAIPPAARTAPPLCTR